MSYDICGEENTRAHNRIATPIFLRINIRKLATCSTEFI